MNGWDVIVEFRADDGGHMQWVYRDCQGESANDAIDFALSLEFSATPTRAWAYPTDSRSEIKTVRRRASFERVP